MKKHHISIFIIIVLLLGILVNVSSCGLLDEVTGRKASCLVGTPTLKWNAMSNFYFIQAEIYNNGDKAANNVEVYYYYFDQGSMQRYTGARYVGTIEAGETVTFRSFNIYESQYGCGIVNCGISEVKWN